MILLDTHRTANHSLNVPEPQGQPLQIHKTDSEDVLVYKRHMDFTCNILRLLLYQWIAKMAIYIRKEKHVKS